MTDLVFLGIAERAVSLRDGHTDMLKWNILGLKNVILSYFSPAIIPSISMVFGSRNLSYYSDIIIKIKSDAGDQIGFANVQLSSETNPTPPLTSGRGSLLVLQLAETWSTIVLPFEPKVPLVLFRPGRYDICQELPGGTERTVGAFYFGTVDPDPLTSERIAAIKSDPSAANPLHSSGV